MSHIINNLVMGGIMAKKIDTLVEIAKKEDALTKGKRYNREVMINGHWSTWNAQDKSLLAYSSIWNNEEVIVVMNLESDDELEGLITVDRNITPAGTKMKDMIGRSKNYSVEENGERNYLNIKLKPNHMAILKKN